MDLVIKCIDVKNNPEADSYDEYKPTLYCIEYENGANIAYAVEYITETVYIDAINVPKDKQGMGIGTAIIESLLDEYDYCVFGLNAKTDKVSWWRRFGFCEISKDDSWIYMKRKASMNL